MPGQCNIQVVEHASARHKNFSCAAFFGRRSVKPDRASKLLFCQIFFQRNCRKGRSHAKQIMATAVTGRSGDARFFFDNARFLRQPWQRVVFTQNADDWFAAAEAGDKSRWDVANVVLNLKACSAQFAFEQVGALLFFVTDFGKLPNAAR